MMPLGLWVVVGWMAFVIFTGIVFLVWGWRRGQFRDIEEAKYRMLEDKEPEPWPNRKGDRNDPE
jgi:cbb3-type cytochrome oxidase maturation protein